MLPVVRRFRHVGTQHPKGACILAGWPANFKAKVRQADVNQFAGMGEQPEQAPSSKFKAQEKLQPQMGRMRLRQSS
jgi:hypothetical protein